MGRQYLPDLIGLPVDLFENREGPVSIGAVEGSCLRIEYLGTRIGADLDMCQQFSCVGIQDLQDAFIGGHEQELFFWIHSPKIPYQIRSALTPTTSFVY